MSVSFIAIFHASRTCLAYSCVQWLEETPIGYKGQKLYRQECGHQKKWITKSLQWVHSGVEPSGDSHLENYTYQGPAWRTWQNDQSAEALRCHKVSLAGRKLHGVVKGKSGIADGQSTAHVGSKGARYQDYNRRHENQGSCGHCKHQQLRALVACFARGSHAHWLSPASLLLLILFSSPAVWFPIPTQISRLCSGHYLPQEVFPSS